MIVDEQEFAESKNASGASTGSSAAQPRPDAANAGNGFVEINDGIEEDLPFI